MTKLAFTISSYRLHDFIRLGLAQLQKLCPDCPVLVSDDPAPESKMIKETTEAYGGIYTAADKRRGHFAGDFQSLINALVFAKANDCDVAVKVSQRFIFRKPESIDVLRNAFADPDTKMATPGRPRVSNGASKASRGFSQFSILTDIVAIRVSAISPEDLLYMYRERLIREQVPWASFIECTIDELHANRLAGSTTKIEELTNPTQDPIYLRRYQASEKQYRDLGLTHGFGGIYPLNEWGAIEQKAYMAKPVVI